MGYGFITNPASFDIGNSYIPYELSDSYGRAILVGLVNTLVVSALGIVLTTIVGIIAGIAAAFFELAHQPAGRSLCRGYSQYTSDYSINVLVFRNYFTASLC